jgi:glycosyltransferase involved in cell wall biosynthesis
MRGYTKPEEILDGIHIYRHWLSDEAGGLVGFFGEYLSALWGEMRLAWRAWRRHRFSVVHICNPPDLLFLVALPYKLFFGARVIFDVHDLCPEMYEAKFGRRGLLYWFVRVAERLTYASADVALATNESVRQAAINRGKKASDRVFVVRTAPKVDAVACRPNPALKKGRSYLVGYVGVMGNADAVEYIIDAADYLVNKQHRTDVHFLLMGTGPEYPRLVERRDGLGLKDYVEMPGRVSNEALFEGLSTMDLGVSCDPINSYNDHCTMNKVLEYMAFGKPQVMFDLKEGRASAADAARYVGENSAPKLAQAISDLLDDSGLRAKMGQSGLHRLNSELNWERSVEQLLRAYETVLERKNVSIIEQKTISPFPKES